ncbi:MAG TPA: hypothetical protein VF417_05525 [Candidatus Methylomirabilis sp.]
MNEKALYEALVAGKVAGYATDLRALRGERPEFVVNPEVYDRPPRTE